MSLFTILFAGGQGGNHEKELSGLDFRSGNNSDIFFSKIVNAFFLNLASFFKDLSNENTSSANNLKKCQKCQCLITC